MLNVGIPILVGLASLYYQSYAGLMVAVLLYMFSGRSVRRTEDDDEYL